MQCASRLIDKAFLHQRSGDSQLNHNGQIPSEEHGKTGGNVPEIGIIGQPLKTGAVVGRGGGIFIQHLGQAMEARVGNPSCPAAVADRQSGEGQRIRKG